MLMIEADIFRCSSEFMFVLRKIAIISHYARQKNGAPRIRTVIINRRLIYRPG